MEVCLNHTAGFCFFGFCFFEAGIQGECPPIEQGSFFKLINIFSGVTMKIISALVCAILFAVFAPAPEASAQIYVVCNNSTVAAAVCIQVNCGGVIANLAPCPAILAPGQCFTWNVPAACIVTGTRVNGTLYPVPAAFPFCYPVAAPPPNWVCYSGGAAIVQVNIR